MEIKIEIGKGNEIRGLNYEYCVKYRFEHNGRSYGGITNTNDVEKTLEENIKTIIEIWKKK